MKILLTLLFGAISLFVAPGNAIAQEQYGKTLNLGLGVGGHSGYSRYATHSFPVVNINYEFDVAKNFTLAPTLSLFTYSDSYYYSNDNYTYRETVIPVGLKGSYYFDDLLEANDSWDFYAAASLGFAIVNSRWDEGYDGDKHYFHRGNQVFLDIHVAAEYHFNDKIGAYLDVSSGFSTIGIAFHQSR
jgi:hypothetical protein